MQPGITPNGKHVMFSFVFLLQIILALSLIDVIKNLPFGEFILISACLEISLAFILYVIQTGRYATIAIALSSLMTFNLLLTPLSVPRMITLPPNLHRKVKIVGETIGFTGVSQITTDIKGFRTTKKVDYKSSSAIRIFAIGGSTTEQIYLDDNKTWTAILEKDLEEKFGRNVEVINTGVSGLRATHHYKTFLNILAYHPDAAIFLMGINDWNADIAGKFTHWLPSSLLDRASFLNSPFYRVLRLIKSAAVDEGALNKESEIQLDAEDSLQRRKMTRSMRIESVSPRYAEDVKRIADACIKSGIKCFFVNQPTGYQKNVSPNLRRQFWMTPPKEEYTLDFESLVNIAEKYNDFLIVKARQAGISSCDIATAVPPNTNYFYDDCHFNEGGARRVAQLLSSCLQNDFELAEFR